MRNVAVLLLLLTLAACSSDADKAASLKQYLDDHWSSSEDYSAAKAADITVKNGDVVMATKLYVDFTQAQELCGWASDWVYGQGNGDSTSTIRVLNRDGDVLSQRTRANDVCSMG